MNHFLAVLLLSCAPLAAQETAELMRLDLEELIDVPIVAASSRPEPPSQTPASAHVVTEATIRARGYRTLLDLIEDLPQFEVQHHGSERRGNTLSVRGLTGNERLVVLYDGVRVTPPSGNPYPLGRQFSLAGAKRVEVVTGPMSALYGADAFSAVVNVVTKSGGEMAGAGLAGAYGQYDTSDAALWAGGALDTVPWRKEAPFLTGAQIAVTAHRSASAEPFLPGRYPDDYAWFHDQYQKGTMRTSPFAAPTVVTAVPVRPYDAGTDALFLHARLTLRDLELGYLRMRESHSSAAGVKPDFSLYVREAVFRTHYSALYGKHVYESPDERWRLDSALSHYLYEIDPQTRFINNFSLYRDAYKYAADRTLSFSEKLSLELADASSLVLGLSYDDHATLPYTADLPSPFDRDKSPASQGFNYPGSEISDLNGKSLAVPQDIHFLQYQNIGSFLQLQHKEWDRLQATLGARYDHNTRYGDSVNPRVGVVVRPVDKLAVKVNYGEAFVAPSPDRSHLHFGSFVPAKNGLGQVTGLKSFFFELPNPGLRPEKLRAWDAEASYRFTPGLWASVGGYHTETTDLIQDDVDVGAGSFKGWPVDLVALSAVNRGFARSYGGTARLDALARSGAWTFKPNAAYSYSAGEVAGNVLPYSAKHAVQAGLELGRGRWTAYPSLYYRHRSYSVRKDPAGNLQSSAPYVLLNLHARCADIAVGRYRLAAFLKVTNLTDLRYRNAGFSVSTVGFPAVPQDPRRVLAGVSAEF